MHIRLKKVLNVLKEVWINRNYKYAVRVKSSQADIGNPLRYLLITSSPLCGNPAGAQSPARLSKPW